jgi:hypothetical protein
MIEHEYIVKLYENHTLEAHSKHIGLNLSAANLELFEYREKLHFYSVRVDDDTLHNLVR